jgi:class 3 adenylate cyclase
MPSLISKPFARPDAIREMPKGRAEILELGEVTVAMARWEPGWRWSTHLRAIAGTASCEVHHLGYSVSGLLRVTLDDGQTLDVMPECVYEIPPGHDAEVVGDEPWVTLEWTSGRFVGVSPEGPGERVLVTVLFTDIVDSTKTLERLGDASWRELLLAHNLRMRHELNRFRGREVATTGDGFLAVFDSATRAAQAGLAMTRAAQTLGLSIRVGIHTGELEFVGGDARGLAVHVAARVMGLAHGGEVVVSSTTHDLLEGAGVALHAAGSFEMKGLTGRRTVFTVTDGP